MSVPTDPQSLLAQAKCYLCLGISLGEALQLALLAEIAGGGGSGSGSGQVVFYTGAGPPVVPPANTTQAAIAYSEDGSGGTFGWNVALQQWN